MQRQLFLSRRAKWNRFLRRLSTKKSMNITGVILYLVGLILALPFILGEPLLTTNTSTIAGVKQTTGYLYDRFPIDDFQTIYGITIIGVFLCLLATFLLVKATNKK